MFHSHTFASPAATFSPGHDSPAQVQPLVAHGGWAGPRGALGRSPQAPIERRMADRFSGTMAGLLDAIDYGLLLLDADCAIVHANRQAEVELDGLHPLHRRGRELFARRAADQSTLQAALAGALHGLRRLVTLGEPGEPGRSAAVSVVPLDAAASRGSPRILLLLGKRQLCEPLSVQWFARAHQLTPAETRVLEALCAGCDARAVAERHGVGLATVRTQIGAIRAKTGADSIRDLVRLVAALPPMMSALHAA